MTQNGVIDLDGCLNQPAIVQASVRYYHILPMFLLLVSDMACLFNYFLPPKKDYPQIDLHIFHVQTTSTTQVPPRLTFYLGSQFDKACVLQFICLPHIGYTNQLLISINHMQGIQDWSWLQVQATEAVRSPKLGAEMRLLDVEFRLASMHLIPPISQHFFRMSE